MTTKAEPAQEPITSILYDSGASQIIPFEYKKTVIRNGKRILQKARLTHTLIPLSNERYFEYEAETERLSDKVKRTLKLSMALWEPKLKLWDDLAESVTGYPEKEAVHPSDRIRAVEALLEVEILDPDLIEFDIETETVEDVGTIDIDEFTAIPFRTMYAGAVILNMSHSFRQETKAEVEEFFAIEGDEPTPGVLASAVKLTKAEKLYNLGKRLLKDTEGYAPGCEVPAWHLAGTTRSFFLRQLARMGKG